jgi:hypothetical protein
MKEFHPDLYNKKSLKFFELEIEVKNEIILAYKETEKLISVTILGFRPGSIICDSRLYFENSTKQDTPSLKETLLEYGKNTSKFEVSNFEEVAGNNDDDDDDDIILGLDWWQIGLVIAGVVIFILLITVIVLCVSVY